jgi:acyl-CoA synthetase (AMP-forming)/AMP-acid ligase II
MAPDVATILDRFRTGALEFYANAKFFRNITKVLPSATLNPAKFAQRWAEKTPGAPALLFEDERYTWKQFNDRANQYAAFYRDEGLRAGDVVALMMDNRPDFLFSLFGLSKLGAVGALINHNLTGKALTHAIDVGDPKFLIIGGEHLDQVREVLPDLKGFNAESDIWVQHENLEGASASGARILNEEVGARSASEASHAHSPKNSETFCYIYTSGTTGLPKAALISNQRMIAASLVFGETMIESGPGERTYVAMPLYHSSAMYIGFGSALAMGGSIALARKFSASRYWEDVRKHDATAILYIGELCRYLLNTAPHPDERRHRVRVGVGNGLRPDIWEDFCSRFGIPKMREFYGATEGNAPVLNFEGRPGMIGRRRRGQVLVKCDPATGEVIRNADGICEEIKVGQTGLLLGKINAMTKFDGYVNKEATQKKILENVFKSGDRYFNSGDLIELHDNGWLSFADRLGDTFRWKGENVSTNEVAEILNGSDGILEANVYGVQVPGTDGRAGMAAINVTDKFDIDELASFVADKFPRYQRPYFIRVLVGGMRTTSTFKHQKGDYRKEGFDPNTISDPLYYLEGDKYIPIDAALYSKFQAGEISP